MWSLSLLKRVIVPCSPFFLLWWSEMTNCPCYVIKWGEWRSHWAVVSGYYWPSDTFEAQQWDWQEFVFPSSQFHGQKIRSSHRSYQPHDFFPFLIKLWTSPFSLTGITLQLLSGTFEWQHPYSCALGASRKESEGDLNTSTVIHDRWDDDLGCLVDQGTKGESHPRQDGVGRHTLSSCYSGQRAISNVCIASVWNVPLNSCRRWLTVRNRNCRGWDCR